ncbi:MAG: hypothetical protein K2H52_07205 [Lachnospiraceae bacterium]|nr:hypothetical protein [Lachnospiraceae bacterium]
MEKIIFMLLFDGMFLAPFILVALDVGFAVKRQERPIFELIAFFVGSIYMALAFLIWEFPDYQQPLNPYASPKAHEPFCSEHMLSIIIFAFWGFFSYFILKFARKKLPPLFEVILLGGVYIGCGLCLVWMFQLLCGARPLGMRYGESDVFVCLCLCIVPLLYLIHAVSMMVKLVKEKAEKQKSIQYENSIMQRINVWFLKGANLFWAALIALLPLLGILVMLLCLFGQQPDGIILAFTKTSDWVLSKEIAPPPVAYDTHYLCTVSLRGHKKLVKPIRYGIRKGEKIVVNRQLCVANAFEQLIMEKTPRFHRLVRNFYDTYGYPISRHIYHAWTADAVYLMMKPLEWIFLLALYLFDEKPEDRICSQYLPKEVK